MELSLSTRNAAIGLSLGRVAFGTAMSIAPRAFSKGWIGEAGDSDAAAVLARSVGARDIVVGGGAALALLRDSGAAPLWLAGQALADAADFAGALAASGSLPSRSVKATLALAGGSAALAAFAAART